MKIQNLKKKLKMEAQGQLMILISNIEGPVFRTALFTNYLLYSKRVYGTNLGNNLKDIESVFFVIIHF